MRKFSTFPLLVEKIDKLKPTNCTVNVSIVSFFNLEFALTGGLSIFLFTTKLLVLQPAKLYKLKHLSKMEVVTNDPSGCTFTLVISHSFLLSYLSGSEYNVPSLWNITKSGCSQFLLWSFFLNAFCISLLCLFLFANAYIYIYLIGVW